MKPTAEATVATLLPTEDELGECALWCEREQALWWTDIDRGLLSRWRSADGAVRQWQLPDKLGSFALCEAPGLLLLGLASGVALYDTEASRLGPLVPVEAEQPATRINDGRCDPQGRFVFGTFNQRSREALGHWYRVGPDLAVERLPLPPVSVANALAFSPDGGTLYFTDSPQRTIWRLAYHADGRLGVPEVFVRLAADDGFPDGAAVDAQGRLWTALWRGGCVACFDPDGREVGRIALPARQPTCPAFGGAAFERLFVTSARVGLDAAGLQAGPGAGQVFVIDGSGRGRAEHRFVTALRP